MTGSLRDALRSGGLLALFLTTLLGAHAAACYFYDEYWPGHPDSFRFETALLPRASLRFYDDYFWNDTEQATIFLCSCSAFVLPPLLTAAWSRTRVRIVLVAGATAGCWVVALYTIWRRYDSYIDVFFHSNYTLGKVLVMAWRDAVWVTALTWGGFLAGAAISHRHRRRHDPHCCYACGYDVRAQLAFGPLRCPECNTALDPPLVDA